MNTALILAMALLSQAAPAPDAPAEGWQLGQRMLTLSEAGAPVYRFDCTGPDIAVTQFGVTKLLDPRQKKQVADNEGAALPDGASYMALATDKTEMELVRASAVRNARTGWDMTIRFRKNEPTFRGLPKANMVSLFTTGFTRAVELNDADRALFSAFVSQCRSAG